MPFQPVKTFDVDEHGPIVRRAGRLQNADELEPIVLVPVAADAVRRLNFVADLQPRLRRDDRADDRLERRVVKRLAVQLARVLQIPPARLKLVLAAACRPICGRTQSCRTNPASCRSRETSCHSAPGSCRPSIAESRPPSHSQTRRPAETSGSTLYGIGYSG